MEELGEVASPGPDDETRGCGVEPVCGARVLRVVGMSQKMLERIFIEAPAGMHWQGSRLVHHNENFVLVEDPDIRIHVGFHDARHEKFVSLARANNPGAGGTRSVRTLKPSRVAELRPFFRGMVGKSFPKKFHQGAAIVRSGNHDGTAVVIRDAARKSELLNGGLADGNGIPHLFFRALITIRARFARDIPRVLLLIDRERSLADKALGGIRFTQGRINTHALIKNEAFAPVVRAATFLEVF